MSELATYLSHIKALDPSLPLATVSNVDFRGTALEEHTEPYTIIPLARNMSLVLLTLIDHNDVFTNNPAIGERVIGFRRALHSALAQLRQREGGMPTVVVLTIDGAHKLQLDADATAGDANQSSCNADESISEGSLQTILQLAYEADRVDVILVGSVTLPDRIRDPLYVRTWTNHTTLIVPSPDRALGFEGRGKGGGDFAGRVNFTLDADGRLINSSLAYSPQRLDCTVAEDAPTRARLFEWQERMVETLGIAAREKVPRSLARGYIPKYSR